MSGLKQKLIIIVCLLVIIGGVFALGNPDLFISYKTDTDFEYIEEDGSLILTKYLGENENIIVPAEIDSKPVKSIKGAFLNNIMVKNVRISEGIETIDYMAFYGCTSVLSVLVPESVKTIGHAAFLGCMSLETVEMGGGVTEIMPYAFSDCTFLSNIILPENLEFIGEKAFSNCSHLQSLNIPAAVKVIGGITQPKDDSQVIDQRGTLLRECFDGCALLEITIDEDNPFYEVKEEKIVQKEN